MVGNPLPCSVREHTPCRGTWLPLAHLFSVGYAYNAAVETHLRPAILHDTGRTAVAERFADQNHRSVQPALQSNPCCTADAEHLGPPVCESWASVACPNACPSGVSNPAARSYRGIMDGNRWLRLAPGAALLRRTAGVLLHKALLCKPLVRSLSYSVLPEMHVM